MARTPTGPLKYIVRRRRREVEVKSDSVKQKPKCRNKRCDGLGNMWIGPEEIGPCPDCSDQELLASWEEARERHAENCAGAHGLPAGAPC